MNRSYMENQVEQLIKRHGECLSNYRDLLLWYWTEVDKVIKFDPEKGMFYIYTWNIHRLTSPESITRIFRRLIAKKVIKIHKACMQETDKENTEYEAT